MEAINCLKLLALIYLWMGARFFLVTLTFSGVVWLLAWLTSE